MGLALLNGQDKQYRDFLRLKSEIMAKIDANLDLIEEIWNAHVMERPAGKRALGTNLMNESNIIKTVNANPGITVYQLARLFHLTQPAVINIIEKYELQIING
jgi:hypothetical protein